MGVRRLVLLAIFAAALVGTGRAGRTTNGSTQYLQTVMPVNGLFPTVFATQAQGTVAFYLNLIAFPSSGGTIPNCGVHCGEILNVIAGHGAATVNGCLTTTGACLDIFVCPSTPCASNRILVDITTPSVGEAECAWPMSTGPAQYTFILNRTAANMAMYKNGVLVSPSPSGCSNGGDPGDINYPSQNCGAQLCDLTLMASEGSGPAPDNFANGTISDVGIWKSTLSVGEIQSLAHCVPPNRIQPENLIYVPVYGVDATEPVYTSQRTGTPAVIHPLSLTLVGAPTKTLQQVGCQPGGAYH